MVYKIDAYQMKKVIHADANKDALKKRNNTMLEMRKYGMTLADIGSKFGICPESARKAIIKAQEREPWDGLGTRERNCLMNAGIFTKEECRKYSEAELLRIPALGRLSLYRITRWRDE